jgi:hypothetical protein
MTASPYSTAFYDGQVDRSLASARAVLPMVIESLGPKSAIDVGCGRGAWLSVLADHGVEDLAGEDGAWVDTRGLLIDHARFRRQNLEAPTRAERHFDLAMSLEVAEHISAEHAQDFVDHLCDCADAVLFSAAVPGQGGTHHVNERRLSYWVERFAKRDFAMCDVLRARLWDDQRIAWWYRQNMVIFARRGSAAEQKLQPFVSEPAGPVDIIHPDGFFEKADLRTRFITHPRYTLRRDLRALTRRITRNWR